MIRDDRKRVIRKDENKIHIEDEKSNEWTKILEESGQKGWNEKLREDEENVIDSIGKKYRKKDAKNMNKY